MMTASLPLRGAVPAMSPERLLAAYLHLRSAQSPWGRMTDSMLYTGSAWAVCWRFISILFFSFFESDSEA